MIPSIFSNEELQTFLDDAQQDNTLTTQPSKTYKIDFDTGEILAEFIDLDDAIQQAVMKALLTTRDRYAIYTSDYGSEIQYILGDAYSLEYLQIEIPRLVTEALMSDDRVSDCTNFVVNKQGESVNVSLTVVTTLQSLTQIEVTI